MILSKDVMEKGSLGKLWKNFASGGIQFFMMW